jgi:hypothetical protein
VHVHAHAHALHVPPEHEERAQDSAATVGSSATSNSPPAYSGLATATLLPLDCASSSAFNAMASSSLLVDTSGSCTILLSSGP